MLKFHGYSKGTWPLRSLLNPSCFLIGLIVIFLAPEVSAYKPPTKTISKLNSENFDLSVAFQLRKCFDLKINAAHYVKSVSIFLALKRDGYVESKKVEVVSKNNDLDSKEYTEHLHKIISQAIDQCSPYIDLPVDQYNQWKNIHVTYTFPLRKP